MPRRIQFNMLSSVTEMMVGPPGEPVTKLSWPSRRRMVGVMELRGRLPGPMALASDWIKPKRALGTPGWVVKSSISSLRRKPAEEVTCEP